MKTFIRFAILLVLFVSFSWSVLAFSDLPESDSHYHSLSYLEFEGVINGFDDGTVRPNDLINRAELVKILVEGYVGEEPSLDDFSDCFPDVTDEWFAPYVCYALEEEWIDGYPDGNFKPSQSVNKVEALKIIVNAFELPVGSASDGLFNDTDSSDWYAPFLQVAVDKNLIEESQGSYFDPTYTRTRGEVSEMVARIMQIQYMDDPAYNDLIKAEFQTFLLLHKLREKNGVTERLTLNPILTQTARLHAKDMAEVIGDMSHESSEGRQSYDRIKAELPDDFPGRTGENLGRGMGQSFQAISNVHYNIFMPESDDWCNHRTTLLSTCLPFTEVGIGVYSKDGFTYFVEDFISTEYSDVLID